MSNTSPGTARLPIVAVPARYPGRWISAMICLLCLGFLIRAFATSENINWGAVAQYFLAERIISGLWLTIVLTILAQATGVVGGVLLASMSLSPNGVLNAASGLYIWLFRGTPALIQIIFWFNIGLVFPNIVLGIPWTHIGITYPTNSLITPMMAAVIALGLNEAAYMAEIVRGGIISVDSGQREAAASIGFNHSMTMRYIILPQAIRSIIPPTGNELISMLKNTSLVSVIAANELLTSAQQIYAMNFFTIELLIVASIWYLILTTIASLAQAYLERRFDHIGRAQRLGSAPFTPMKLLRFFG